MNPPSQFPRRSPPSYAAAPGGGRNRGFDSPPRHSPRGFGTGGFRPTVHEPPPPLSGQKRGNPRGGSPDRFDKGGFAKLFVGSVPRTATEGEIRPLFEEHGEVVEVALIKDKKTGQQQGCCFIKFATSEEADRAIRALHNQHTLHGGLGPIQVRYADGERERLGAVEYKLFVGSMNKQATEKEVEEVFSPYGVVEDVYLMRDELKQSRGCGFVKYSSRDMALSAINGLNGIYTMRGCDQPLTVRFADPKRPRPGDLRNPAFGGPGSCPRFQAPGARPLPNFSEPMSNQFPTSTWHPNPTNLGLPSPGIRGFGAQMLPRSGDMALPSNLGGHGSSVEGPLPGMAVSSSTTQQSFNQSTPHVGQQISPLQKPIQSPQSFSPSLQQYPQTTAPYAVPQAARPVGLPHAAGQIPYSQALPSQKLHGLEPPSQLAQMLSQQTQNLQASFQSSQQAFNQLQQQLQQMQPSKQGLSLHQTSQSTKQQPSQWTGIVPQTVANIPATKPAADTPSATSVASVIPGTSQTVAPAKCIWTEHTSPDGYKYYYNSSTGESRWEKPAELALSEKQQQHQKPSMQQPQTPSLPQNPSSQQHSQIQQRLQPNLQPLRPHLQLQQQSMPSTYQTSGSVGQKNAQDFGYSKVPTNSSVSDPRFQQGVQAAQEWMWKNKPTGA